LVFSRPSVWCIDTKTMTTPGARSFRRRSAARTPESVASGVTTGVAICNRSSKNSGCSG
jgi:hypothetical protein